MADRYRRLLREARDRALARPWLLAPPALAAAGRGLAFAGLGAGLLAALPSALLIAIANALFAELWLGDGESVDADRAFEAGVLYLIPLPVLALFAIIGGSALSFLLSGGQYEAWAWLMRLFEALSRFLAGAAIIVATFGVAAWRPGYGALQAFSEGARAALAEKGLVIALAAASLVLQTALGLVFGAWTSAADGASPQFFAALDLLASACGVLVTMAVCIGLPLTLKRR